jgi:hypothetical protein
MIFSQVKSNKCDGSFCTNKIKQFQRKIKGQIAYLFPRDREKRQNETELGEESIRHNEPQKFCIGKI